MTTSYIQAAQVGLDLKAALESLRTDCLVNGTNASAVQADLDATEGTIITDLGALRTAVIAALTAIDAMATKLNGDSGVTATDFATNNVATSSPGAITTA